MMAVTTQNSIGTIDPVLAEIETSIAGYPLDLRKVYDQSTADLHWSKDIFGNEASDFTGLCNKELALAHRLMFASAFAASAAGLPGRELEKVPVASTRILDIVTGAGLPPREFLRHYGEYGNQFTWKLLKLTGRISDSNDQSIPDPVEGL